MTEKRSMANRVHLLLTVLCAGTLLTLGLFVALGKIEIRQVDRSGNPATSPAIEPVQEGNEYFAALGQEAYCFKYEGTWIDCWIEVEKDGEKSRLGEVGMLLRESLGKNKAQAITEPSGHLVWVRRKSGDKELWDLGIDLADRYGKLKASYHSTMSSPPLPSGPYGGRSMSRSSGGSLKDGNEITLYSFDVSTIDHDKKSKREWSAALKSRAAK